MPDFTQLGLAANSGLFALAAIIVCFAGTRISHYAETISQKTGVGQALVGIVLLAGVTSLPEIGVTATAAAGGDAPLAVNNLFGSIALQVALLAIVDFVIGRRALTSVVPEPGVLLQGALNILLLSIAGAGIVVGDRAAFGIGLWSWACLAGYVASVWILSQAEGRQPWLAARHGHVDEKLRKESAAGGDSAAADQSLQSAILWTVVVAAVILVAGFVVAETGGAIAEQTGIGSSFVGFALVAAATSLPEASIALSAARLGMFTMAISGVLGTNLINVGLLFLVDAVSPGDPVLNSVGSFSLFGILLGTVVTALFVIGLVERRDRTLFRMGIDSVAVLVAYLGGLALLYTLRNAS